jgi:hypothetical protein
LQTELLLQLFDLQSPLAPQALPAAQVGEQEGDAQVLLPGHEPEPQSPLAPHALPLPQ